MHILFAGGGTAGHINPALSVANYLTANYKDVKISYIGTEHGLESRLVPAAGYDFYTIKATGFQRKPSLENIKKNIVAVENAIEGSVKARKLIKELKPDVVVGTGGYVSGPVLREAALLGIPTAIHEQNAYPGVTTKMLIKHVDRVMLAMPEAKARLDSKKDYSVTGNPVREALIFADRENNREKLGIPSDKPLVLSFGGSLGAKCINEAVVALAGYAHTSHSFYLYHGTGRSGFETTSAAIKQAVGESEDPFVTVVEYINNMDELLSAADLVICRAGAITLGELQVCGKASVLIPSPYVAENHQYFNALTLKNAGAAELIEEKQLTGEILLDTVKKMISDPELLEKMGKNARESAIVDSNKKIAEVILSLVKSEQKQ